MATLNVGIKIGTNISKSWTGGSNSFSYTAPTGGYAEIYIVSAAIGNNNGSLVMGGVTIATFGASGNTISVWGTALQNPPAHVLYHPIVVPPGVTIQFNQPSPLAGDAVRIFGMEWVNTQ